MKLDKPEKPKAIPKPHHFQPGESARLAALKSWETRRRRQQERADALAVFKVWG